MIYNATISKILGLVKNLFFILSKAGYKFYKKISNSFKDTPVRLTLEEEIQLAYEEWKDAEVIFSECSGDLIDYAIFRLNAAERKYVHLLNLAKQNASYTWGEVNVPDCK